MGFRTRSTQLVAALVCCGTLLATGDPARAGRPKPKKGMLRAIALGAGGSAFSAIDREAFDRWGNAQTVTGSKTSVIRLQTSWGKLFCDPGLSCVPPIARPADIGATFAYLNHAPGASGNSFALLDRQIKAANDAKVRVILGISYDQPSWAVAPGEGLPTDTEIQTSWAWFVSYLLARYPVSHRGSALDPDGATGVTCQGASCGPTATQLDSVTKGNPLGAYVWGLELMNEPNHGGQPDKKSKLDKGPLRVARMIKVGAGLAHLQGWGGVLLAPAISDIDKYQRFTRNLLTLLALPPSFNGSPIQTGLFAKRPWDYRPAIPVLWSQHNYRDVADSGNFSRRADGSIRRAPKTAAAWVAKELRRRQRAGSWGKEKDVWLTEGGLRTNQVPNGCCVRGIPGTAPAPLSAGDCQRDLVLDNFCDMASNGHVRLWTNYPLNDSVCDPLYQSGLFGPFVFGPECTSPSCSQPAGPTCHEGQPKPLFAAWSALPMRVTMRNMPTACPTRTAAQKPKDCVCGAPGCALVSPIPKE